MPHGTKRLSVFLFFMGICLIPTLAAAQQAPPPLIVEKLSDTVYWTQGGAGGNTGIIVGTDGRQNDCLLGQGSAGQDCRNNEQAGYRGDPHA